MAAGFDHMETAVYDEIEESLEAESNTLLGFTGGTIAAVKKGL